MPPGEPDQSTASPGYPASADPSRPSALRGRLGNARRLAAEAGRRAAGASAEAGRRAAEASAEAGRRAAEVGAEAGRRAAEVGKVGLSQAEEQVRRKLDERATTRSRAVQLTPPPEPVQWNTPVDQQVVPLAPTALPAVRPAASSVVTPYVPAQSPTPYQPPAPRAPLPAPVPAQVAPVPLRVAPVTPIPAQVAPVPAQVAPVPAQVAPVPPQVPQRRRTVNGAVIAALIVAVIFPPAGLGLAKSARRECREDGRRGAGLALVAHIVAAVGTTVIVLVALTLFAVFAYGLVQVGNGLSGIGSFLGWIGRLFG